MACTFGSKECGNLHILMVLKDHCFKECQYENNSISIKIIITVESEPFNVHVPHAWALNWMRDKETGCRHERWSSLGEVWRGVEGMELRMKK